MTGAMIHIGLEDVGLNEALAAVVARASNLSGPMDEIGSYLVTSSQHRFETESGPGGTPWKQSRRALEEGGQTLTDHAHLRSSLTHHFGSDYAEAGTNLIYAAIHQLGGKTGRNHATEMPARPFLGFDADDEAEIQAILADHLMGGLQ